MGMSSGGERPHSRSGLEGGELISKGQVPSELVGREGPPKLSSEVATRGKNLEA